MLTHFPKITTTFLCIAFYLLNITNVLGQHLQDYLNEAERNFIPKNNINNLLNNTSFFNTTSIEAGYFTDPLTTVSGNQKYRIQFLQQIPWIGKGQVFRKTQKITRNIELLNAKQELAYLLFEVKQTYYQMYQYQLQKDIYLLWSEKLRAYLNENSFKNPTTSEMLQHLKLEAKLVDISTQLQLIDGKFQNEVLKFNQLLKKETLDTPELPLQLAMPDIENTFSYSDPYDASLFLNFEEEQKLIKKQQQLTSPWLPTISAGLHYIGFENNTELNTELSQKNIIEPRLQLAWNLFSKKRKKQSKTIENQLLENKIQSLNIKLQTHINDRISARISYDAATEKLNKLNTIINSKTQEPNDNDKLEILELKSQFKLKQIEAVVTYYILSSKMLLYF